MLYNGLKNIEDEKNCIFIWYLIIWYQRALSVHQTIPKKAILFAKQHNDICNDNIRSPINTWYQLKGHAYLNKLAAFSYKFVKQRCYFELMNACWLLFVKKQCKQYSIKFIIIWLFPVLVIVSMNLNAKSIFWSSMTYILGNIFWYFIVLRKCKRKKIQLKPLKLTFSKLPVTRNNGTKHKSFFDGVFNLSKRHNEKSCKDSGCANFALKLKKQHQSNK